MLEQVDGKDPDMGARFWLGKNRSLPDAEPSGAASQGLGPAARSAGGAPFPPTCLLLLPCLPTPTVRKVQALQWAWGSRAGEPVREAAATYGKHGRPGEEASFGLVLRSGCHHI